MIALLKRIAGAILFLVGLWGGFYVCMGLLPPTHWAQIPVRRDCYHHVHGWVHTCRRAVEMSTPIEIVREMELWRSGQGKYAPDGLLPPIKFVPPHTPAEHATALASVLEMAERFQLQQWQPIETAPAKDCLLYQPESKGRSPLTARMLVERGNDRRVRETTHWMPLPPPPLAEMADRLREGK